MAPKKTHDITDEDYYDALDTSEEEILKVGWYKLSKMKHKNKNEF